MLPGLLSWKWKLDLISISSPMAPPATRSLTWAIWRWNGKTNASQSGVPVCRAASSTRTVSRRSPHSGFSHSTGLPAARARSVHSACSELGSGMYSASMPGSSIRFWYPPMARSTPLSLAYFPARPASRPATAAAVPPASRSPGRNWALAMLAVPRMPHRTLLMLPPPRGSCGPSPDSRGLPRGRVTAVEREAHPAPLVMGEFHGVDHLLHPQSVVEVALVPGQFTEHLTGEVRGEVGVVKGPPRLRRAAARGVVARR